MHSLIEIISMNKQAAIRAQRAAAESETSRHCSYAGTSEDGVVLHSAKLRNTVFLKPGAQCNGFLAKWFGTNSADRRDVIVESYFE